MHDFLPSFGTQPLSGGCCVPFTEHTAVAQWGVCLGCRFVSFFFLLCSPCFFIMCSRAVVIFALKAVTSVTIDRVLAWILATLSAPASLTGHRAFEGILCLRQLLGALMVVLSWVLIRQQGVIHVHRHSHWRYFVTPQFAVFSFCCFRRGYSPLSGLAEKGYELLDTSFVDPFDGCFLYDSRRFMQLQVTGPRANQHTEKKINPIIILFAIARSSPLFIAMGKFHMWGYLVFQFFAFILISCFVDACFDLQCITWSCLYDHQWGLNF